MASSIIDVLKAKLTNPSLPPCKVLGKHHNAQCTIGSKGALKEALLDSEPPEFDPTSGMTDFVDLWAVLHMYVGMDVEDAILAEAAGRGVSLAKLRELQRAGDGLMEAIDEDPEHEFEIIRRTVTTLTPRERRTLDRIRAAAALLRTDPACDSLREFMRRTRFDYHTLMKFQELGLIDLPWVKKRRSGRPELNDTQTSASEALRAG